MISLAELWLPIVLSAVFVFVMSSLFHMVIPLHKGDFKRMPGEEKVLEEMRRQGVPPGSYMFPCAVSPKEMCSPERIEKCKLGPVGFLTVIRSGPPGMAKNLVQWFLYTILIGVFVAYAAMLGLERGAAYRPVFRLTGTIAILGYALGDLNDSIWKGRSWGITLKFVFEGVVYGLITAGTFGWLWPEAP